MEQQPTCGQGLAHNAAPPAKLAEVFAAVAEVLEIHLTALDPKDKGSRPELLQDWAKQHSPIKTR